MHYNKFSPNSISYKELNSLLITAKKDSLSIVTSDNSDINEMKEFNDMLSEWKDVSKKILTVLSKKDQYSKENRNPKSLIAFGAMGAHINMALQALKATGFDQ